MNNKQTFGAFICRRRKELGLTQKEFAEKLYVTDSAVSKWERGLAYPDITLLQDICTILQVSEKELLSASEDTEGRRSEQLAKKYVRLIRTYRAIQWILYGLLAAICLICNLAVQHTLSWFWIVLSAELTAASLTLLPVYVPERTKGLWCASGFTGSLLVLLAVCCLYTGGDWFFVAAAAVLFGLGVVFLPTALRLLPPPWKQRSFTVYLCSETVLLLLLFLTCWLRTGGTWLVSASLWTVFGLSTAFFPRVLRQLPLGSFANQKALIYLAVNSVLLLLGLVWEGRGTEFLFRDLLVALLCLSLPWGLLGCIRYLPIGGWFRASAACFWSGLWFWLFPWGLSLLLNTEGLIDYHPWEAMTAANLLRWNDISILNANISALVLIVLFLLAVVFGAIGVYKKTDNHH